MPDYICESAKCADNPANCYGRFRTEDAAEKCPRCSSDEIIKASKRLFNFGHSYSCLECGFRSDYKEHQHEPCCMICGAFDVCWIPTKFASPSHVDQTLKRIATRYGLSDMGQRGGTRPGERARQSRIQETPVQYKNIGGINVPITNGVHSCWSETSVKSPVKINAGTPYAGLSKPRAIPTKVVHEFKG